MTYSGAGKTLNLETAENTRVSKSSPLNERWWGVELTRAEAKLMSEITDGKTTVRDSRSIGVIERLAKRGLVTYERGIMRDHNDYATTYFWVRKAQTETLLPGAQG